MLSLVTNTAHSQSACFGRRLDEWLESFREGFLVFGCWPWSCLRTCSVHFVFLLRSRARLDLETLCSVKFRSPLECKGEPISEWLRFLLPSGELAFEKAPFSSRAAFSWAFWLFFVARRVSSVAIGAVALTSRGRLAYSVAFLALCSYSVRGRVAELEDCIDA